LLTDVFLIAISDGTFKVRLRSLIDLKCKNKEILCEEEMLLVAKEEVSNVCIESDLLSRALIGKGGHVYDLKKTALTSREETTCCIKLD